MHCCVSVYDKIEINNVWKLLFLGCVIWWEDSWTRFLHTLTFYFKSSTQKWSEISRKYTRVIVIVGRKEKNTSFVSARLLLLLVKNGKGESKVREKRTSNKIVFSCQTNQKCVFWRREARTENINGFHFDVYDCILIRPLWCWRWGFTVWNT